MQSHLIYFTKAQKRVIKHAASVVGMSVGKFVTYSVFEAVALVRNAFKPSNRLRKRLGLPIAVRSPQLNVLFDRRSKRSMRKPLPCSRMKRIVNGRTVKAALK